MDGTGILWGIEVNIKNTEGGIDHSGPMSISLDLIIAGFYESAFVPRDRDANTQAMIAMMISGGVHIISYPGNPRYPVDTKAIMKVTAKYQVALEISNFSFSHSRKGSKDNCRVVAVAVCDAGS